jgi:spore maturation protein CgeB
MSSYLFIGPYSKGSTSIMRVNYIIATLKPNQFKLIDVEVPFFETNRLFRSMGSRWKIGPLMGVVSNYVRKQIDPSEKYDLVWIDKGVYISPDIIEELRPKTKLLIHYTPDPAFTFHRSRYFFKAVPHYDFCITTKSFEMDAYKEAGARKVIYCTQGYDKAIHHPYHTFNEKDKDVTFVGHYETYRGKVIKCLLDAGIQVHIVGFKWKRFCNKYKAYSNLHFHGDGIYGEDYARFISSSYISLGLVSKWIPELHTTRTMEIPACGTLLVTELNSETSELYKNDEAVFYENVEELVQKVSRLLMDKVEIEKYITNANNRLAKSNYDYESIVQEILQKIGLC